MIFSIPVVQLYVKKKYIYILPTPYSDIGIYKFVLITDNSSFIYKVEISA